MRSTKMATALSAQEPAFVAKYAFELAQGFNLFYHRHHILSEANTEKRDFLLRLSRLVERQLVTALDLLGIEAPDNTTVVREELKAEIERTSARELPTRMEPPASPQNSR